MSVGPDIGPNCLQRLSAYLEICVGRQSFNCDFVVALHSK